MIDPDDDQLPDVCNLGGPVTRLGPMARGGYWVLPLAEPTPVRAADVVPVMLRFTGTAWEPVLTPRSAAAWRQCQVPARPPLWYRPDPLTVAAVLALIAGAVASVVLYGVLSGLSVLALGVSAGIAIGGRHG